MAGVRALDLSASVRYDDYSDFGGTTNPRIGFDWKPVESFLVRGNYNTSFHAPSLADSGNLIDSRVQVVGVSPFRAPNDPPPGFPGSNFFRRTILIAGAGQSLDPEEGKTWSVGAEWTPVHNLKLSATYYNTVYKNTVSIAQFFTADFFTNPTWLPYYTLNPTLAQVQAYAGNLRLDGITSLSDLYANGQSPYLVVDARRKNFGSVRVNGIDFGGSYSHHVGFGVLYGGLSGTYALERKTQVIPGGTYTDNLGNGTTRRFGMSGNLGLTAGKFNARATVTYGGGYDVTVPGQTRVGSFTTADLFLGMDLGDFGVFKQSRLTLNLDNVFDTDPPNYNLNPGYINGGTVGRLVSLGILTRF
jgi:iron complex outermembrane receptor protein